MTLRELPREPKPEPSYGLPCPKCTTGVKVELVHQDPLQVCIAGGPIRLIFPTPIFRCPMCWRTYEDVPEKIEEMGL